jgi:DNA (cytosine-5)-methyltransferase 1
VNEQPTHLDLFSGIGGFSLAFEREGFRTIGFSEVDPYASAVLRKHWPGVPNYGDIRSTPGPTGVDVLTGGFPCQPFSYAGKRRGKEDDRYLWPEMCRVIAEAKPTWIVGENVAGIINMALDRVLSDLEAIGYSALPIVVPACAVDAPHRRDRVWIVAHSECPRSVGGRECEIRGAVNGSPETEKRGSHAGEAAGPGEDVANASSVLRTQQRQDGRVGRVGSKKGGTRKMQQRGGVPWLPEPNVGRVANGIPSRVDRLRCLGNSIVPQVAQVFARFIYHQLRP